MSMKKYIPVPVKAFYRRVEWIGRNFSRIKQGSIIRDESHYLGPITYDTDSLTTSNNCDFINEARFAKAYAAAAATKPWEGFSLQWRTYIVCWFADMVKKLEGDYVECGVNTGAYSRALVDYIDFNSLNKKIWLLDTYEGLVKELVSEEEIKLGIGEYFDAYKNVYEQVKETFRNFNAEVIKGPVPDTLPLCKAEKICYLSIDMNCVEPEIAAAEYFWDKIVPGGVVILDDYGFPQHILQKKAFDEFARKKNISILTLPTAQGIIIKK
jgi:O-methyltransferase